MRSAGAARRAVPRRHDTEAHHTGRCQSERSLRNRPRFAAQTNSDTDSGVKRSAFFWGSVGLVVYTYAIFPVVVIVRALLRPSEHRSADITPSVSVLVAAHEEQDSIGAKVRNTLALDYPPERLEVVVASDGSSDTTVSTARRNAGPNVRVLDLPRVGKAAALEAAVAASTGEILVFTDANSMFARDAVRQLVRPLADPAVGGVAGNQRYQSGGVADAVVEGERAYWNFERLLKVAESRGGSTVSATGAIYAIRRSLFDGVPTGVTDDFAVSTSVIAHGRRLVFAPDAVAWEAVAGSSGREWGRKVRIMTRGLRGVYLRRQLLHPGRTGFYAIQLFSHKVLRRIMGLPLLAIALVTPALWGRHAIYRIAAICQAVVYGLGLTGLLLRERRIARSPVLSAPAYFLLVNAAALAGLWNVIRGRRIDRWEPERSEPS
jgi:cellulose synthase/poly-beta-1,6-N-acetylglucosamine synthase-like glycosyltransferase